MSNDGDLRKQNYDDDEMAADNIMMEQTTRAYDWLISDRNHGVSVTDFVVGAQRDKKNNNKSNNNGNDFVVGTQRDNKKTTTRAITMVMIL